MRIGILTFHDALNCGAVLQAYALQSFLEAQGHDVAFLDYSCRPKFTVKRILGKSIHSTAIKIRNYYNALVYGYGRNYNRVLNIHGKSVKDRHALTVLNDCFDAFIVGSDQVWNFKNNLNPVYLLDFVKNKKKVAYAVSMGQCEVAEKLFNDLKNHLNTFDFISCREANAVQFLSKLMNDAGQIKQCVDPTLLVNPAVFQNIIEYPSKSGYIASYILNQVDGKQIDMINSFVRNADLPLINLKNPDTCIDLYGAENCIVSPYEWLGYIKNADYVICGSFHAAVFSLIFNKKFVVIESKNTHLSGGNQRVRSLLRPLGLEYRCIYIDDIREVINRPIDWKRIEESIQESRRESGSFLINTLNK